MDDHGSKAHGIIQCDKCEYCVEDLDLMKQHMMKHTGRFNFNFNKCEWESTRQSMVEDHKEQKHASIKASEEETMTRERCEKDFAYRFHFKQHACEPAYKFPCEKCTFIAHELVEITEHMVQFHTSTLHGCTNCNFKTGQEEKLKEHAGMHCPATKKAVKSKIADDLKIKCDQCEFTADGIPDLITHIRGGHSVEKENCKYCKYQAQDSDDLKEHVYDQHAEVIMIHTVAKQMDEVSDRFELFETFKVELGNAFNMLLDATNVMKQELFLIRNKQAEMSSNKNNHEKEPKRNKSNSESTPSSPSSSSLPSAGSPSFASVATPKSSSEPSASSQPEAMHADPRVPAPKKIAEVPKIIFIGDSISANIHMADLEHATGKKIITAKAYSAVYDDTENVAKKASRFPKSNFADVIPAQLRRTSCDTLILQAGSVDVTNLRTDQNPSAYTEYFRQEVVQSAKNLFSSAVNALKTKPSLKKVVIMKQIPRYDPLSVDPLSLKPVLSQLFNSTLTHLWTNCLHKDKIFIGNY